MSDDPGRELSGSDHELETFQEQILAAGRDGRTIRIVGGDSKSFYGEAWRADETLSTLNHRGIVDYLPSELVITARAGTLLSDIEKTLAARDQMLGFEPPNFSAGSTIGGVVAAGLSGPARPYRGSCRDHVLGMEIINGRGELLRFGGQVMKNVAGYDIGRLQSGALGSLGVITEISLRVAPRPGHEVTLCWDLSAGAAVKQMAELAGRPWPISAMCHAAGQLRVRMSGSRAAVEDAIDRLQPGAVEASSTFWRELADLKLVALQPPAGKSLWRASLPPASPPMPEHGHGVIDWGGAQRWYVGDDELGAALRYHANSLGGHVSRVKGDSSLPCFDPSPAALAGLTRRVEQAFDPAGVFARSTKRSMG